MELKPVGGEILVFDRHDLPHFVLGKDFETVGQALPLDDEGMIPGHLDSLGKPREDRVPFQQLYVARFAVHQLDSGDDFPAESLTDSLMPQADAQNGDFAAEAADCFLRNPRRRRVPRARRDD